MEQRRLKQHNNEASAKTARSTVGWFYHSTSPLPPPPAPGKNQVITFYLGIQAFVFQLKIVRRGEDTKHYVTLHLTYTNPACTNSLALEGLLFLPLCGPVLRMMAYRGRLCPKGNLLQAFGIGKGRDRISLVEVCDRV